MKTLENMGVKIPDLLLPANIETETWSVVACDQYTQDRDYWTQVQKTAGNKPSTLNIILPEVYLNDSDKTERIKKIREQMKNYLSSGVFAPEEKEMVYVERKTAYGRVRKGLVTAIDLETYEWKPFSKALIRATEATIVERIPPRMEIRNGAPLESPHIMLLVSDEKKALVEGTGERVKGGKPLYQGNLMMNSGSISGWAVKAESDIEYVRSTLEGLFEKNKEADGSSFLFAVGDGNHSLATAKAVWDEYKKAHPETADLSSRESLECAVRYALVEIVNIYDDGLTFEPIHRVVFNAEPASFVEDLKNSLGGKVALVNDEKTLSETVSKSTASFGFVYKKDGKEVFALLDCEKKSSGSVLAVSFFQPALDEELKNLNAAVEKAGSASEKVSIDYIHGDKEVFRLGKMDSAIGILLPPVDKSSFFDTINSNGPLPRKSFSMGEADEKRFYLECRRLFS